MRIYTASELAGFLGGCHGRREPAPAFDLAPMSRILEWAPEDMTVTVEAGLSLASLQKELAAHRQWLPVDPPNSGQVTIHDLLARDLNGPRRLGYGTIREHLIGLKVVLADGRVIKSGGKVVKNVAGYDLAKLFIGARDSLGIIVEATFKVRPLPEAERIVSISEEPAQAGRRIRAVLNSDLAPVILDLHRVDPGPDVTVVLGLAGTREDVEGQCGAARGLGFAADASLEYEERFWKANTALRRASVLPSRLDETIARLGSGPFVARAGNGVVYHRGEPVEKPNPAPVALMRRIKAAYDPAGVLPEITTACFGLA